MIIKKIKELGYDNVKEVLVSDIPFEPSLIELCKMNSCGNYGKCYTCPPHVGETDTLIKKAKNYQRAIVFQKIYKLEDSFDFEGMESSNKDFGVITQKVNDLCKDIFTNYLILGAGGCRVCRTCGVVDGTPCRFPDKAFPSLESYSIQVSKLAEIAGVNYINRQNTVTYFGAVLV